MTRTPRWMIVLWTAIVTTAAVLFIGKMMDFALTLSDVETEGFGNFGAVAIGTYLTGMLPLVFLTLWGVLSGQFRDIEAPKFRMMELDQELEECGDALYRPAGPTRRG